MTPFRDDIATLLLFQRERPKRIKGEGKVSLTFHASTAANSTEKDPHI